MKAKSSPNIALIKYWGKKKSHSDFDRNIGLNPSISMTLSQAFTETEVRLLKHTQKDEIFLDNIPANALDQEKISKHLDRVFDFLQQKRCACYVNSKNNFPMGVGLASSASAFSALTLATLGELLGIEEGKKFLKHRSHDISALSRRGSGSAARSIEGPFCEWVHEHAQQLDLDWKLRDTILILSSEKKKVSSTEGHAVAESSPLMHSRLSHLVVRTKKLREALLNKDLKSLGTLIEEEAKEMHAIMQSSTPPIQYLLPETKLVLSAVEQIKDRDFYWTLDAGPNPHFISERPIAKELKALLKQLNIKGEIWEDESGYGAELF